jgi:hypothetical protein
MIQYQLVHNASLNRRITLDEYEQTIACAKELGFESLFLQYLKSNVYNLPDFSSRPNPYTTGSHSKSIKCLRIEELSVLLWHLLFVNLCIILYRFA